MFAPLFALALGAALQAAPAPAPPPGKTTLILLPPKPRVESEEYKRLRDELPKAAIKPEILNPAEIADHMDYPEEAIRKSEQGLVGVWLLVGMDGRVQRCGVEISSDSASLDAQTCDLFVAKAKFRPAKDKRGRAVAALSSKTLVWRIEESSKSFATTTRTTLIVAPDSSVRSCKTQFLVDGSWVEVPTERCSRLLRDPNGLVLAARVKSKLHDAVVVFDQVALTDPAEALPSIGHEPGEVLIFLRSATVRFAADGTRESCTIGESIGLLDYSPDLCAKSVDDGLVPVEGVGKELKYIRVATGVYLSGEPN